MVVENILEVDKFKQNFLKFFLGSKKISAKVTVHCSCGKDYKIRESFEVMTNGFTEMAPLRRTKCSGCEDISYIRHNIWYNGRLFKYFPEI